MDFDDLNGLATDLADQSYGPAAGDAAPADDSESIAVAEPSPEAAAPVSGGNAEPLVYWQPGQRRFGDLADAASRFVEQAQAADQTEGQAEGVAPAMEGSASPGWGILPGRRFGSLLDDAARLRAQAAELGPSESPSGWVAGERALDEGRRTAQPPAQETESSRALFARRGLPTLARLGEASSEPATSPPVQTEDALSALRAALTTRRSAQAVSAAATPPTAAASTAERLAIGGYFLPKNPTMEITAYWRQWEGLTLSQAKAKAYELAQLGIPPYLWRKGQWIPLFQQQSVAAAPVQAAGLHVGAFNGSGDWQQWDGLDEDGFALRIKDLLQQSRTPYTWSDAAQRWVALL